VGVPAQRPASGLAEAGDDQILTRGRHRPGNRAHGRTVGGVAGCADVRPDVGVAGLAAGVRTPVRTPVGAIGGTGGAGVLATADGVADGEPEEAEGDGAEVVGTGVSGGDCVGGVDCVGGGGGSGGRPLDVLPAKTALGKSWTALPSIAAVMKERQMRAGNWPP
jgi:hypothetical protein